MATSRSLLDISHALVTTAHEEKAMMEIMESLEQVREVFAQHPELLAVLREPTVSLTARQQALSESLHGEIHTYVINALCLLQAENLLDELERFFSSVETLARDIANHREIQITTAVNLTESERTELTEALHKKFGGTQRLHERVDRAILGGLILRIGDWLFDASIKSKINRLRQNLYA